MYSLEDGYMISDNDRATMSGMGQQKVSSNLLPNADQLQSRQAGLASNVDMQVTEEDSMERKMILNSIYANNLVSLKQNSRKLILEKSLNWMEPHPKTDLDELITPLTCAAFLGRLEIVELLLQNQQIDLEMQTQENEYTALQAGCMAGHFEVVQYLAENGADVNAMNSLGQTPLIYCFSRLMESAENAFENKTICFRIAETLFSYGADVNKVSMGTTLLMNFCGISMKLDPVMLEVNLSVVKFLVENGADPYLACESNGQNSFEMANRHCEADKVKMILMDTKQINFHPVLNENKKEVKRVHDPVVDTSSISAGCCSFWSLCGR